VAKVAEPTDTHSLTGSRVKPGRSPRYVHNKSIQIQNQKTLKAAKRKAVGCAWVCVHLRVHIQGHPGCGGKAGLALELTLAGRSLRWVIYEPPPQLSDFNNSNRTALLSHETLLPQAGGEGH